MRMMQQCRPSFVEEVFGGDVGALLVHFAKDASVRPEDLEVLRAILNQTSEKNSDEMANGGDR